MGGGDRGGDRGGDAKASAVIFGGKTREQGNFGEKIVVKRTSSRKEGKRAFSMEYKQSFLGS